MLRLGESVAARIGQVRDCPVDRGALSGQAPVGRSFPHGSGSARGGPRYGARQVSGHAAHWAPAQCLRSGDGNTSGLPARTVTRSARVCGAYDTVDLGVGIGPDTAGIAVPHPTWTAQAGASSIRLEPGAPIGPVDVITVWSNNVLNPASTSTKRAASSPKIATGPGTLRDDQGNSVRHRSSAGLLRHTRPDATVPPSEQSPFPGVACSPPPVAATPPP